MPVGLVQARGHLHVPQVVVVGVHLILARKQVKWRQLNISE